MNKRKSAEPTCTLAKSACHGESDENVNAANGVNATKKSQELRRVAAKKYGTIRECKDETGESQPDACSAEGCDSPCRIRVRAL